MRRTGQPIALYGGVSAVEPMEADTPTEEHWPVSVKGVLSWNGRAVVLRNDRGEWELPGGRLEASDDSPQDALRREIGEELGVDAEIGSLVDSWIYDVEGKRVLILTYACEATQPEVLSHSDEHTDVGLLTAAEFSDAPIPSGYLRSLERALGD
ncbi:NUDIX hydrolase [Candidatus Poriferisodalis sp.]|uniref:NUDIX hydrolase n=1 Tax=Candidatus Poriferisodalis sp. TaxID=3101277 RepID=UPI003C6F4738